jgi:DNA modification methylase
MVSSKNARNLLRSFVFPQIGRIFSSRVDSSVMENAPLQLGDDCTLYCGTAETTLPMLPSSSFDCVVTDPPYPEVDRPYGRWTVEEWEQLMGRVVEEVRRLLKPTGSAVFILQPNSERVGRVRPWLFEFMARWAREWNLVQDVWWWNTAALPTKHCDRKIGLLRPSIKACVWLGAENCYRAQGRVLWTAAYAERTEKKISNALRRRPSGHGVRDARLRAAVEARGGSTPFNLLPIPNTNSSTSAGAGGHGAGTPEDLVAWWVRYLCPPGGTVLDPFMGSGTTARAAYDEDAVFTGVERDQTYFERAVRDLKRYRAAHRRPSLRLGEFF